MSPLLFSCVAVACLISEIGAATKSPVPRPTTTPVPDLCHLTGYDVSELKKQDYWVANVTGQPSACVDPAEHGNCTFYFAFCHELHLPKTVAATNCHGAAVCQVGHVNKTQRSFSLGMYTDNLRFSPNTGSDAPGFTMNVFGGSNTTACTNGLSSTVKFQCNESAVWTSRNLTDFISVLAIHDPPDFGCHFEIILYYNGACGHMTNHTVPPTHAMPTPTRGHMNHTSTRVPHSTTTHTHTSMNVTSHPVRPTTSHSTGNHSSTKPHPGSTTKHHPGSSTKPHPGSTTKPHPGSTTKPHPGSTTKGSSSTKAHPASSHTKPAPTNSPHPHPHTHPITKPNTKPITHPTENPLQHKVAGLTAGVVIFALIAFALVLVLVGVFYYFYKRAGSLKYGRVSNINDE